MMIQEITYKYKFDGWARIFCFKYWLNFSFFIFVIIILDDVTTGGRLCGSVEDKCYTFCIYDIYDYYRANYYICLPQSSTLPHRCNIHAKLIINSKNN